MSPITSIPREHYRREHLDNAIESARTASRYAFSRGERATAGLVIAYVEYLDAVRSDWRELAVKQVQADYPRKRVEIVDLIIRLTGFELRLGLNGLEFSSSLIINKDGTNEQL